MSVDIPPGFGRQEGAGLMRITTKGQVTIPQHIRERLGLLPHTEVDFTLEGDVAYLRKVDPDEAQPVSYTHLRAHETDSYLVCRLLLEKKKTNITHTPTNKTIHI